MADGTGIEWTDATWNPVVGCEAVSPGCDHCYAARDASGRLSHFPAYAGLAKDGRFVGEARLLPERLRQPLRWNRPRRVFVNSMSDLFHDDVPAEYIAQVFVVMAMSHQHTFQVLTKRHARMRSLLSSAEFQVLAGRAAYDLIQREHRPVGWQWPLPNVWLGVSVESQRWADIRVPALLDTPAAVRWLSCEPLLGPVDLGGVDGGLMALDALRGEGYEYGAIGAVEAHETHRIDWVVVGGESGPGARPMHPDWARSLRDQCVAARIPFHFKQHGEWHPIGPLNGDGDEALDARMQAAVSQDKYKRVVIQLDCYGRVVDGPHPSDPRVWLMERVGKKSAGRVLDGRVWDGSPVTHHVTRVVGTGASS